MTPPPVIQGFITPRFFGIHASIDPSSLAASTLLVPDSSYMYTFMQEGL
jgi:hypothetical protein